MPSMSKNSVWMTEFKPRFQTEQITMMSLILYFPVGIKLTK